MNFLSLKANYYKSIYIQTIISSIAFILIISRRPDAILNPQFWAEDGCIFFAQAYNNGGIQSLFSPYAGYLLVVPRLAAAFSMFFSLKAAPLIFNLIAIIFQILPVNFLLSRFSKLIPNINYRIFISFLYLALPGCSEVNANITNVQWHLALLMFMIFVAQSSRSFLIHLLEIVFIFIGGLTGPFSILLIPIVVFIIFFQIKHRSQFDNFFYIKLLVIMITAVIQMIVITTDEAGQERLGGVGSSFLSFNDIYTIAKILTNQLFLTSILGSKTTIYLGKTFPEYLYTFLTIVVVITGAVTLIYLLIKLPVQLKAFIIFAALMPFAQLASELTNLSVYVPIGNGGRYWFNIVLAFSLGIIWLCYGVYCERNQVLKKLAASTLLLSMLFGIISDWQHPAFADLQFTQYVDKFEILKVGEKIIIPVLPNLSMELVKH